jgi:hypothetical protein
LRFLDKELSIFLEKLLGTNISLDIVFYASSNNEDNQNNNTENNSQEDLDSNNQDNSENTESNRSPSDQGYESATPLHTGEYSEHDGGSYNSELDGPGSEADPDLVSTEQFPE